MSSRIARWLSAAACSAMVAVPAEAQSPPQRQTMTGESNRGAARYVLSENMTPCRLAPEDAAYAAIDGRRLGNDVDAVVAISRRYRDQGNQYWGRISGTISDTWTQDWVKARYREIGLQVTTQELPMAPNWMPERWSGSLGGGSSSRPLESLWPTMGSPATPAGGLTLPVAYVGLGSEAEFASRDVRGKAVVVYSIPTPGLLSNSAQDGGVFARAEAHGAAAVLTVMAFPGNVKTQLYPVGLKVPTFTIGRDDFTAIRETIERTGSATITLNLTAKTVSGLKTALVIGTLPGKAGSREDIVILAHRDAYFDGAIDNGSGMAVSLAVAEYFAKKPREERPRTLVFVSTPGHHGSPPDPLGPDWLHRNRDTVFRNTALIINAEHEGTLRTEEFRSTTVKMNTYRPLRWFLNGSDQLAGIMFDAYRSFCVPTWEQGDLSASGEMRVVQRDAPALYAMDSGPTTHTDQETADVAVPSGMAAVARAYARIIDQVNRLPIAALRPPPGRAPAATSH